MYVRWVTVFVDRPADGFDEVRDFWRAVSGTTMSSTRGAFGEFATFVPPDGDPFVRIQRVQDGPGGCHLDVHVDDPRAAADRAVELGASEVADLGGVVVLRSPGGLTFCTVSMRFDGVRPAAVGAAGVRTIVDQVSIDAAPDRFDGEGAFWEALTGWQLGPGVEADYAALDRPPSMPLRLLLQRRGNDTLGAPTRCHLDLACEDVGSAVEAHLALGATHVADHGWWTVMRDPSGHEYCLTARDPDTGAH